MSQNNLGAVGLDTHSPPKTASTDDSTDCSEKQLPIAILDNARSPVSAVHRITFSKLAERFSKCNTGAKDGRAWMPADIEPGPRTGERVKSISFLVLDVEADADPIKDEAGKVVRDQHGDIVKRVTGQEPPSVDDMLAELALHGWHCCLHTSYSHFGSILPEGIDHPRYRLIFDLPRPLLPNDVKPLGLYVVSLLGIADCTDKGCLEPARLFYLPRCPAERLPLFRHGIVAGVPLDVDALLAEAAKIEQAQKSAAAGRRGQASGSVIQQFNDAHDVGMILEQHGYHSKGRNRWTWPGSTTGMPGVRKLPESERVFSSHGGDPLNDGKAHDAFDCWCSLNHGGDMTAAVREAARLLGLDGATGSRNSAAGKHAYLDRERKPAEGVLAVIPEPLPTLPPVMPFDYDYLPKVLRDFVKDISERMQCPPDFSAVAVFVMMGTVIGRKVGIRPMRQNDWTVIVNLWAAVVGNSGVMKSPTLSASLSPIKQLQAWAFEDYNNRMSEFSAQEEVAKLQKSAAKAEAKKKLTKDKTADVSAMLKPEAVGDAPILKRYMTNNASYEALGEILMENPNGVMVEADEIIGLLKQLDAPGQDVARAFYLTAADGDKPYTFDRIMRGKGLHIPALILSIIGGIQPGVMAGYVRQATEGGAGADGLMQRFGLMVYPDVSPEWCEVDRYPDTLARDAINKLVERLDDLQHDSIRAETDHYGGVPFLRFDDEAQAIFSEWRGSLEARLRSGDEHPSIVSHLSKYRKLIPSLALINHLCSERKGPVPAVELLRAIAFSEYLESHARRIYSFATRPDIDAAKNLLKKLTGGRLSSPFKVRDIYRAGWAGLETLGKALSAIALLQEYGHLIPEEVEGDKVLGGRPTMQYRWNRGPEQ